MSLKGRDHDMSSQIGPQGRFLIMSENLSPKIGFNFINEMSK